VKSLRWRLSGATLPGSVIEYLVSVCSVSTVTASGAIIVSTAGGIATVIVGGVLILIPIILFVTE
jgi:hypothetical protein